MNMDNSLRRSRKTQKKALQEIPGKHGQKLASVPKQTIAIFLAMAD
jgi:hypothetical protein